MSGAKFGRSIMGLAGEVANPSLKHTRFRWFLCRKPDAAPVDTARIKKAPPAGGAKGFILMHR